MKTITVSSASRYARGKARNRKEFARVTFLTGEGSARRSNTAHPEYRPGVGFVGSNPDKRAIPLNALYEEGLAEAESVLEAAEVHLEGLERKLENLETVKLGSEEDLRSFSVGVDAAKIMLEGMIQTAKAEIVMAEAGVADAKTKLDIVQRELPLEVQFIGRDL